MLFNITDTYATHAYSQPRCVKYACSDDAIFTTDMTDSITLVGKTMNFAIFNIGKMWSQDQKRRKQLENKPKILSFGSSWVMLQKIIFNRQNFADSNLTLRH